MNNKPKVLVIEDEKFLCELIQKKLTIAGADVVPALTGEDGLILLSRERPGIILLDLLLPGIDGFEVLRQIKADQQFKDIPVLVVSNLGDRKDIERAMQMGAVEYFVKTNHSLDEIVEKVWQYAKK